MIIIITITIIIMVKIQLKLYFCTVRRRNDQCITKSHTQSKNNCRLTLQLSKPIVPHDVMGRRSVSSRATSTPHFQQRISESARCCTTARARKKCAVSGDQRPPTSFVGVQTSWQRHYDWLRLPLRCRPDAKLKQELCQWPTGPHQTVTAPSATTSRRRPSR